ncbi:D-alanyl-lipoteichoic acid biosynthesis protein DltD [Neobacillus massiliamazoniensis]|uniref:Protein DltD n=1 Tax=Neobacillus massiliamazoniensis TaxID=1499688 RepID=A0A0U1NSJ6_9BACI|nr:D-alanyl-lipoteichoic acid biosynthesis protein DltD [Neobacillus massiliamazoniensis]CRK81024.1 putative D-alanine esterase for lipoteichoic acid and wall teichoic acid synthesis [Neobacillus massiliamazoniensis]
MKKPVFGPMILAVLVLFCLVIIPNSWIETFIPKNRVSQAATDLNPVMFQGKYIQSEMLEDNRYLPIYGSSELSRLDRFHPSNYFQVTNAPFTPFLIGRGGTESLIHFLNFSEHMDQLKGKKLVFIISPQWFQPNGTDESHFVPNYSTLQGYDFAFNNKIDPSVKKQAIERMLKFSPVKDDPMLSTLYKGEISNSPWDQQKANLVRPFAYVYRNLLEKKDLYYSYVGSEQPGREIKHNLRHKSWNQLAEEANQLGASQATNNQFDVINSQYDKMKKMVPSLRGYKHGATYGTGPEYKDFQLVLDVLKQSGADPLFISIPVNGKWYDYTGFPKQGRTAYYQRITKQIEAEGFPVADFSDHEYDPYFMKDTIHIGWKGWVYTDKAIEDFYYGVKGNDEVVRAN